MNGVEEVSLCPQTEDLHSRMVKRMKKLGVALIVFLCVVGALKAIPEEEAGRVMDALSDIFESPSLKMESEHEGTLYIYSQHRDEEGNLLQKLEVFRDKESALPEYYLYNREGRWEIWEDHAVKVDFESKPLKPILWDIKESRFDTFDVSVVTLDGCECYEIEGTVSEETLKERYQDVAERNRDSLIRSEPRRVLCYLDRRTFEPVALKKYDVKGELVWDAKFTHVDTDANLSSNAFAVPRGLKYIYPDDRSEYRDFKKAQMDEQFGIVEGEGRSRLLRRAAIVGLVLLIVLGGVAIARGRVRETR